jgi:hypothetical protein
MNDTIRLDAMIENGWAVGCPVVPFGGGEALVSVFDTYENCVAQAPTAREALDVAIAKAK